MHNFEVLQLPFHLGCLDRLQIQHEEKKIIAGASSMMAVLASIWGAFFSVTFKLPFHALPLLSPHPASFRSFTPWASSWAGKITIWKIIGPEAGAAQISMRQMKPCVIRWWTEPSWRVVSIWFSWLSLGTKQEIGSQWLALYVDYVKCMGGYVCIYIHIYIYIYISHNLVGGRVSTKNMVMPRLIQLSNTQSHRMLCDRRAWPRRSLASGLPKIKRGEIRSW